MNRRRWIGSFLAVTILATAGWHAWVPIAIYYHKQCIALADRRLQAINVEKLAGNRTDYQSERVWYARSVHHRNRLVALGYLFHACYELNNVPRSSFLMHRDAIYISGVKTFPMMHDRYWGISTSKDHMWIDVYDLPKFKSQWDKFAQKYNDPVLVDQYVDERNGDAEHAIEPKLNLP